MIRGAIFDMDGVLLDSMPVWDTIGEQYLRMQGKKPRPGLQEILFTKSMMESAAYIREEYQVDKTEHQILEEIIQLIYGWYKDTIPLKRGVRIFLQYLKDRNIPMTIATSSDKKLAVAGLTSNGILEFFENIITCREVGVGKESPLVYEEASRYMGTCKQETWVFEDSLHGIRTAKQAGFYTVGIYDKASHNMQQKIQKEASFYLESFEQMQVLVEYWEGEKR